MVLGRASQSNFDVVPVAQKWRERPALSGPRTSAVAPAPSAPLLRRPEPLLPVLIVLHQETSTPGRVGNALRALGHPLDIRRPRFGDPLPETLDHACRRGHLRRPDERQRPRRLRSPGNRLDRGSAAGAAAVSRHLPRRPDARQAVGRAGRAASRRPGRRSAIIRSARPPPVTRSARTGRIRSITGIARDFSCLLAPNCWPRATTFRCRRSSPAMPSASSFIPM